MSNKRGRLSPPLDNAPRTPAKRAAIRDSPALPKQVHVMDMPVQALDMVNTYLFDDESGSDEVDQNVNANEGAVPRPDPQALERTEPHYWPLDGRLL